MAHLEIKGIGIHVKVADLDKSRAFYESLGFKPVFAYGDEAFLASLPGVPSEGEKYRGIVYQMYGDAEHKYAVGELEIAEDHIAVRDKSIFKESVKSPKISASVHVKSTVPLFTNPLVTIKFPVRHYIYETGGIIQAAFRDPDGFVLVFSASYSDEEFKKVSALVPVEVIRPAEMA